MPPKKITSPNKAHLPPSRKGKGKETRGSREKKETPEDADYEPSESEYASKRVKKPTKHKPDGLRFSQEAVGVLRGWLDAHDDDPYPSATTKAELARSTGLTYEQVQHWFINARMRLWVGTPPFPPSPPLALPPARVVCLNKRGFPTG